MCIITLPVIKAYVSTAGTEDMINKSYIKTHML